ncbi:MAG TPA: RNA polymerase sigma-70 factor [Hymenobacter sp.]|jgi:RNA polymerase sigma-70 factor (ECF subfamily)
MPTEENADILEARLAALQHTDGEAFMGLLFRTFYQPLGNVMFRVVQDRATTEDLLQDLFLKVWNNRDTLVITTTYKAYLHRTAMNTALHHLQKHKRQVPWDDAHVPEPSRNATSESLDGKEAELAVAGALKALPPQCRVVFLMSRQDGMSYQQIAEALNLAPKTVENQMGKALRLMRERLSGLLSGFSACLVMMVENIF